MKHFEDALFLDRPNRFTVICKKGEDIIKAHLSNSGSLLELLLPGRRLLIKREEKVSRKLPYTAWAVYKKGLPVLLHTHYANKVAKILIERGNITSFEGFRTLREEVKKGRNRFDLLLKKEDKELIVEVKSCTLFEDKIAMFPDAVTLRGRRHLEELSILKGAIIFLIHSPDVEVFLPNFHVDPDFSEALFKNRKKIKIVPITLKWDSDLKFSLQKEISIDWETYRRYRANKGGYILVIRCDSPKIIDVGSLGRLEFPPGFYIYAGSALSSLSARIRRHLRKKKSPFWHIDYLISHSSSIKAFPIRSSEKIECDIAEKLSKYYKRLFKGFGSSDCNCDTHLFFSKKNPLQDESFVDLIQYFRLRRLIEN